MNKEPKKHHYIPQFILRNFCFDNDRNLLYFFNKKNCKTSVKTTKEIFMVRNLYRDDINNPNEPMKLEKDMACFENEIAQIITGKFLNENELSITLDEDEKLKVFFAVMAFRSKITSKLFGIGASEQNKLFYSMYQENGDLSDFWKRNLGNLVNCRSLKEIWNHNGIDDPMKLFFQRDICGFFGRYFVLMEKRGPIDFIVSDSYPTIDGIVETGMELSLYSIIPISPNRVLLFVNNGAMGAPKNVVIFNNDILKKPTLNSDKK